MRINLKPMLAAGGLALLAACATMPQSNPALERARENVRQAEQDSTINRLAPVELRTAQQRFRSAETRWQDRAGEAEVNHLAYRADRAADMARETARLRQLDARVDELRNERERVQLDARAVRAERRAAQTRAERDRAEAERLRAEFERQAEAAERAQAQREAQEARELAQLEAGQRALAEEQVLEAEERRLLAEQRAAELEAQTQRMRDEAERLEAQLRELEARPTERGLVLTLGADVLFDFDRYDLKPGAERTVGRIAAFLNEYPERQVLVEGFTDSVGSRDYNMGLSERRADAVRTALVARDVAPDRIQIRGYGPDYPVAGNDTDAGRQMNRRVEVIISDDEGEVPER